MSDLSQEDIEAIQAALDKVEQEQKGAAEARSAKMSIVAKDIEGKLTSRMGFRKVKENQWLESLRAYLGSLSSYNVARHDSLLGGASERTAAHRPEVNITREKCETAIAQTMAFQFAGGDKNWNLRVPQTLDIDPEDAQGFVDAQGQALSPEEMVAQRVDLMERQMETHLEGCHYGPESRKAGWNRVVLGTGIMKAPTNAQRLKKIYVKTQTSDGKILRQPKLISELVPTMYSVNPWYFFPDDTTTDIKDAENSIELHPMSKTQLKDLLKNTGFDAVEVQACIDEEPKNYINSPFNDPSYLTQGINLLKNRYMVLEYHGPVKKSDLEDYGMSTSLETPSEEMFMEIWVCNSRVIRMEYSTLEGCYRVPYAVSPWEPDPATIFGFGVPSLVRDQQRTVNETWKMMLDNAGISAGPQMIVDTTLINPADGVLECTPWKVWYINEFGADATKAIQFFMPQNAFEGLSAMFSLAMGMADKESSIPNLSLSLNNPTGAADSATGMAIAQANATSPLFYKSEQWDDDITKPLITMLYDWEMQYNPDDSMKATFEVDVKTSTSMLQNSIAQQKLEKLVMMANQPNSPLAEWLEMDGLAQAFLLGMHLPTKGIVKTPQKVAAERAARPPAPPDPALIKAQADAAGVENDKARIALETRQLEVDADQKHNEAVMKYEAQMRTDDVREREANATVLKGRYDYMAQMAALAQKDDIDRAKIMADMNMKQLQIDAEKFLGGAEVAMRARDQRLKEKEMKLKAKTGSGI